MNGCESSNERIARGSNDRADHLRRIATEPDNGCLDRRRRTVWDITLLRIASAGNSLRSCRPSLFPLAAAYAQLDSPAIGYQCQPGFRARRSVQLTDFSASELLAERGGPDHAGPNSRRSISPIRGLDSGRPSLPPPGTKGDAAAIEKRRHHKRFHRHA